LDEEQGMPFYFVAVEGVIGVGKTTLARQLRAPLGAETILEIVEENPFLSDFYQDQAKYAFQTQIFFLLSRFRQMQFAAPETLVRTNVVSDYLLAKDCIFAKLTLNPGERDMHGQLYPILASRLPQPDLVVYLYANTDLLMERIATRDRPFERTMARQYIDRLRREYEAFFGDYHDAPLLRIDTNQLNFVGNLEHSELIVSRIRAQLGSGNFQERLW
jgi:deoxyguanosine kinase